MIRMTTCVPLFEASDEIVSFRRRRCMACALKGEGVHETGVLDGVLIKRCVDFAHIAC